MIIVIVISSLVYYFVVFFSELYGKIPDWAQKLAGKLKQSRLARHGTSMHSKTDLSFHNNPLMAGDAMKLHKHKENADKAVAERDQQIQQQQEQNKMLKELINRYEKNEDLLLVRWGVVDSYYKKEIAKYQYKMKMIVENMLECQTIINNIKNNE